MCSSLAGSTFESVGEPKPLASLVNFGISYGQYTSSVPKLFLAPANLPSLRLFHADGIDLFRNFRHRIPSLDATALHHLRLIRMDEELPLLLLATRQLRSLECDAETKLSVPDEYRFESALVAIRIQGYSDESGELAEELLEEALESGLIDRETVVFFAEFSESQGDANGLRKWCQSHDMRVEWEYGALQHGWQLGWDYDIHRKFARWVDRLAEERITAARKK